MHAHRIVRRGSAQTLTGTKPRSARAAARATYRPTLRPLAALARRALIWGAAYAGVMLLFALVGLLGSL